MPRPAAVPEAGRPTMGRPAAEVRCPTTRDPADRPVLSRRGDPAQGVTVATCQGSEPTQRRAATAMSSDFDDLRPPVSLTPVERQTFVLLHKVLAYLDTNESDHHERMVEVLTEGFTIEYENVFTPYSELSKADCKLVFDISTCRVMKASLKELDGSERDALLADHKYVLTFQGFDGNDAREGKMRGLRELPPVHGPLDRSA